MHAGCAARGSGVSRDVAFWRDHHDGDRLGFARSQAAEFSFILGMITLTVACGYKLLDAWRDCEVAGASLTDVTLGFAAAAISAFLVVRWL